MKKLLKPREIIYILGLMIGVSMLAYTSFLQWFVSGLNTVNPETSAMVATIAIFLVLGVSVDLTYIFLWARDLSVGLGKKVIFILGIFFVELNFLFFAYALFSLILKDTGIDLNIPLILVFLVLNLIPIVIMVRYHQRQSKIGRAHV